MDDERQTRKTVSSHHMDSVKQDTAGGGRGLFSNTHGDVLFATEARANTQHHNNDNFHYQRDCNHNNAKEEGKSLSDIFRRETKKRQMLE